MLTGPELDAAVAKACGIEGRPSDFGHPPCFFREVPTMSGGLVLYEEFQPSTDANAAFEAAEKFGLWDAGEFCRLMLGSARTLENHLHWHVYECDSPDPALAIASGETPQLAICNAILALAEQREATGA